MMLVVEINYNKHLIKMAKWKNYIYNNIRCRMVFIDAPLVDRDKMLYAFEQIQMAANFLLRFVEYIV